MEKLNATTYRKLVKDDSNDFLEVEVGDIYSENFENQIKYKRWDNEVNFSVRMIEDEQMRQQKSVRKEKDKIRSKMGNIEIDFFDKGDAFKFDYKILSKPATNVLRFSLHSKGLDFNYQPEITDEEAKPLTDKEGITLEEAKRKIRPAHIVGSYAVYHQTKGGAVRSDDKDYKAGKAGHIYRPKLIDANGWQVWGDLHIDPEKGIYEVTIPQEFLDTCQFPIFSNDTFGYESGGGSSYEISACDFCGTTGDPDFSKEVGSYFNFGGGDVSSITASLSNNGYGSSEEKWQYGIYDQSDNSFIASTQEGTGTTNGNTQTWYTLNFSSDQSLTSGNYWLLAYGQCQTNDDYWDYKLFIHYDSDTQGGYEQTDNYPTWSDPFSATSQNNKYSIYATYTASGGGTAYSHTASDSVGMADTTQRTSALSFSVKDTLSMSDVVNAVYDSVTKFVVTLTDYIQLTKPVAIDFSVAITNSLSLADQTIRTTSYKLTKSAQLALTDAVSRLSAFTRSLTDTLGLSDETTRKTTFTRQIADTLSLTDLTSRLKSSFKTITDTLSLKTATSTLTRFKKALSDTLTLADTVTTKFYEFFSVVITDTLSLATKTTKSLKFSQTIKDTLSLATSTVISTTGKFLVILTDTLSLATATTRKTTFSQALQDTVVLSDLVSKTQKMFKTLSDALALSDKVTRIQGFIKQLTDSISLATATARKSALSATLTATLVLSDATSRIKKSFVVLTDTLSLATATTISTLQQYALVLRDKLTLTTQTIKDTTFLKTLKDTLTLKDKKTFKMFKTLKDTLTLATQTTIIKKFRKILSDTLSLTTSVAKRVWFSRQIRDIIGLADKVVKSGWTFILKNTTNWSYKNKNTTNWSYKSKNETSWTWKDKNKQ